MHPAAAFIASKAIKVIGKEIRNRIALKSLESENKSLRVNRTFRVTERDDGRYVAVKAPSAVICERPATKLVSDVSKRMKSEGISTERWTSADIGERKLLIEKLSHCMSQEMLIPAEKRAGLKIDFSDSPDSAENGALTFDKELLACNDSAEVYTKVFEKVAALDGENKDRALRPLSRLFRTLWETEAENVTAAPVPEKITPELETPEVFADFTEASLPGVAEARLKLDEISSWIKEINPRYSPFSPYGANCGTCAFYVHERINGNNLGEAGPVNIARTDPQMESLTGLSCQYMSVGDIENVLRSRGPGSDLIVGINRANGAGHWFNAFYDGEKIYTLDGQTGKIMDWPHDYGNVTEWCALV